MNISITNEIYFSQTIQFGDIKKVKIELLQIINTIISKNLWFQEQAAQVLKINQPMVSKIKHLKTYVFSLNQILLFLLRLNYDIKLIINHELQFIIETQPSILKTKIALMCLITDIIIQNGWTQKKAGELLKMDQGKVSNIKRLKVTRFSINRLISFLILLGCKIELIIERTSPPDKYSTDT